MEHLYRCVFVVRSWFARLAQLAEALGSSSSQSGFESQDGHVDIRFMENFTSYTYGRLDDFTWIIGDLYHESGMIHVGPKHRPIVFSLGASGAVMFSTTTVSTIHIQNGAITSSKIQSVRPSGA